MRHGGATAIISEAEIETETPYEKEFTYYEAEDAVVSGACVIEDNNYASGQKSVGWVGNGAANSVTFNTVEVETAGTYELKIFYISGEKRNLSVKVNGQEPISLEGLLSYHNDWSAVGRVSVKVELEAGVNTICLLREDGYAPSLDRIAVAKISEEAKAAALVTPTPVPTQEPTPAPTQAPAESETPTEAPEETPTESADAVPKRGPSGPVIAAIVAGVAVVAGGIATLLGKKKKK